MLTLDVVTRSDFFLSDQPMLVLVSGFVSALLPEFISAAADLFVQIDRNNVLANFRDGFLDLPVLVDRRFVGDWAKARCP